jgi:membrane fusion protein (multidrug efflux system)
MTDPISPQAEIPASPGHPPRRRARAFLALATAVVLGGATWAFYAFVLSANSESTDDAYVSGDVVQITSEAPGNVIGLHADDTQLVKAGQILIDLDPADAEITMSSAEAGLAQAVRNVKALQAQAVQLRAQIDAREADTKRAQDDTRRRAALIATGAISKEDFATRKTVQPHNPPVWPRRAPSWKRHLQSLGTRRSH